jgi:hypothetical protein
VARLNPVEVAVNIELQQHAGMITRPAGRPWLNPAKAQVTKIKLIDKDIDHTNRIVFGDIIFQLLGKQSALLAVHTLNKTLHQTLPSKHGRIIAQSAFLHSLDPEPQSGILNGRRAGFGRKRTLTTMDVQVCLCFISH